jgi:hypothetical protein
VRYVRFIPQSSDSPELAALERRFRARFPAMELTGLAVLTYDSVMLLADALRAGARTREAVRAHLASLGHGRPAYAGLSGTVTFDSTGAAAPRYRLAEVTATGLRAALPCGTGP